MYNLHLSACFVEIKHMRLGTTDIDKQLEYAELSQNF